MREDYGSFQLVSSELEKGELVPGTHVFLFLRETFLQVGGVGFVLLAGAGLALFRARRSIPSPGVGLLWVTFLLTSVMFLFLVNAPLDPIFLGVVERFYILPTAFFALLCAVGLDTLLARIEGDRTRRLIAGAVALLAVALSLAIHRTAANQRDNRVVRDYATNLLHSLPEGALLFSRSDLATNSLSYLLYVLGERDDVIVLDQEKMTYPWYCAAARERFGERGLVLPGERYDGAAVRNIDLVRANEERFPIFSSTSRGELPGGVRGRRPRPPEEDRPPGPAGTLAERFEVNLGLWERFEKGSLNPVWGEKTFEREALRKYGDFLFNLGFEAEAAGKPQQAVAHYRESARLAPGDWRVWRNLGKTLSDLGRKEEAASALERSLVENPEDPERENVRRVIEYLRR